MNNRYLSFLVFFLFLICLSACRSSQAVKRSLSATLSADARHSRVADSVSLAHRITGMSLQADSIVVWMVAGTTAGALDSSLPSIAHGDSTILGESGAVDKVRKSNRKGAVAESKPALTKVVLSGVRINAKEEEKKVASSLCVDSSSTIVNENLDSSEDTKVVSSHAYARIYIVIGILVAFGVLYIRKRMMGG